MQVKTLQVGTIRTNCYLLEDEQTKAAAIIDPGDDAHRILALVEQEGVTVEYILLTHGHYDHTTAVPALHSALPSAQIYIHEADANGAGSKLFPLAGQVEGLRFYDEGDQLALGSLTIRVLHTPGHSPGSVSLVVGDVLFSGDTLFCSSMGRTDLAGGSHEQIMASLKRLSQLEGDYKVLPGHEWATTMSREREYNYFMKDAVAHY